MYVFFGRITKLNSNVAFVLNVSYESTKYRGLFMETIAYCFVGKVHKGARRSKPSDLQANMSVQVLNLDLTILRADLD